VLLDEPLVALDPETAGDIRRMLRDQLVSTTTVAVTHDAADAVALADRLLEHRNLCQQRYIPAYVVGCIVSIEGLY
jgi:ABC-type sulfate/molybdate transport systems ATPase subunit